MIENEFRELCIKEGLTGSVSFKDALILGNIALKCLIAMKIQGRNPDIDSIANQIDNVVSKISKFNGRELMFATQIGYQKIKDGNFLDFIQSEEFVIDNDVYKLLAFSEKPPQQQEP